MIYMYKIAIIGDKDTVLGFKALGLEIHIANSGDEARKTVDTLARDGYGIIFVTEQIANLIPETISRYDKEAIPAIILIPNNQGTLNIGMDRINKNVEKAIGTNIL